VRRALVALLCAAPLAAQQRDTTRPPVPQDTTRLPAPQDTASLLKRPGPAGVAGSRPPISARRAFFYSAMLPGLGQAALDRRYTGAGFFLVEVFSLALVYRSGEDLRMAKAFVGDSVPVGYAIDPTTGLASRDAHGDPIVSSWQPAGSTPALVQSRKLHLEDWLAVVIFNHLVSGADAFVAAELWDFPTTMRVRAVPLPGGRTGFGLNYNFR
jgi:hypothetical protein